MTAPIDIRGGLANALDALDGFNVVRYQITPTVETIYFWPEEVAYDEAGSRGLDRWTWVVRAVVGFTVDVAAQMRLDELLASSGASSMKATLEADSTLGGAVHDLRVVTADGYQLFQTDGRGASIGSTWTVEVLAGG